MYNLFMAETARDLAIEIFRAALRSVDPRALVGTYAEGIHAALREGDSRRLLVAGFGKAAVPMAEALEDRLNDCIGRGIVITKHGHSKGSVLKRIEVVEAGHPVPDDSGLEGTERIIDLLRGSDDKTLVVCLISGGGSALLVSPCEGVSLSEKRKMTESLLRAGADIYEMNTVRKHISRVKGGRLAQFAFPGRVISLILSDVMGDRLDVIASGPTAPDGSTYHDALQVLKKYGLEKKAPPAITALLRRGVDGVVPETPREGDPVFQRVENVIIGNIGKALEAARQRAAGLGLDATVLSPAVTGEARDAGRRLAAAAAGAGKPEKKKAPLCLISGGETTVTVRGAGMGGRNTELALAFAVASRGKDGITFLSAGTDGTDGPTDAAGAIVDGRTMKKAEELGLDPEAYLDNNDSYAFFSRTGDLLITGPTGTNVMDIQIAVVE